MTPKGMKKIVLLISSQQDETKLKADKVLTSQRIKANNINSTHRTEFVFDGCNCSKV